MGAQWDRSGGRARVPRIADLVLAANLLRIRSVIPRRSARVLEPRFLAYFASLSSGFCLDSSLCLYRLQYSPSSFHIPRSGLPLTSTSISTSQDVTHVPHHDWT